jgi:hypothetical protein
VSKGLGWTQQGCLQVIRRYEEAEGDKPRPPTTFEIAADVYQVAPDADGNRWVTDAQHVATKRALIGLRRKGYIIGFRTGMSRTDADGRTELCHHWMNTGTTRAPPAAEL